MSEDSPDRSRANSVNPNPLLQQLIRQRSNHSDLTTLRNRVVQKRRRTGISYLRRSDNDGRTFGHVRDGGSGDPEGAVEVGFEGSVELFGGDVLFQVDEVQIDDQYNAGWLSMELS